MELHGLLHSLQLPFVACNPEHKKLMERFHATLPSSISDLSHIRIFHHISMLEPTCDVEHLHLFSTLDFSYHQYKLVSSKVPVGCHYQTTTSLGKSQLKLCWTGLELNHDFHDFVATSISRTREGYVALSPSKSLTPTSLSPNHILNYWWIRRLFFCLAIVKS